MCMCEPENVFEIKLRIDTLHKCLQCMVTVLTTEQIFQLTVKSNPGLHSRFPMFEAVYMFLL